MDRIKRISKELLHDNKEKFGTDFLENKKILDQISIVRSKGLKNELAGFITKFIKREIKDKELKLQKEQDSQKEENFDENESVITKSDEPTVEPETTSEPEITIDPKSENSSS